MIYFNKQNYRNFIIKIRKFDEIDKQEFEISISHRISPSSIQKRFKGNRISILMKDAKNWIDKQYNNKFIKIECQGYCSCGSNNIEYGDLTIIDLNTFFYPFKCEDCGKSGKEYYTFKYSDTAVYN